MAALLFDAEIVARGPGGERVVAAGDFFTGFLETDLAPDEMIVEVRLPTPRPGTAICEFARRHGDFAIVAVAASVDRENGTCRDARVVLGGVAGTVQRATGAEAALIGSGLDAGAIEAAAQEAAAGTDPPGDIHGSADYRRHLVRVLTARAIEEAAAHA
jgi:carbon-monoxide dehydrogenase medium subunit